MVSLILPAFNEERIVLRSLRSAVDFMKRTFRKYEIILVNDGSTDNTLALARLFANDIRIISYPENRGKGYAVGRGIQSAKGDYIFFTDCDLAYPLTEILSALDLFKESYSDMVIGTRSPDRKNYSFLRRISSLLFSYTISRLLGLPFPDLQCGFKGFTAKCARDVFSRNQIDGFGFDFSILYIAKNLGKRVDTLPVVMSRPCSSSHVNLISDSFKMLMDALFIKFHYPKGDDPIEKISSAG